MNLVKNLFEGRSPTVMKAKTKLVKNTLASKETDQQTKQFF